MGGEGGGSESSSIKEVFKKRNGDAGFLSGIDGWEKIGQNERTRE